MPSDAFEELFDRERLLGGLPAKRASALLFLIESRTARLTAQSRQAMARFQTRAEAQRRELHFIEAFALGREPPLRPTIQDLERHAPRWESLVARNPRVQAALAHRIGEKYCLARGRVDGMRTALGLDDPAVAAAYEALYALPLDSVYAERLSPLERLRWARAALNARLEDMSPFWTAYSLTVTETVGSTIVALPIAVAAIGPLPAVAILVLLGLVNVLTVAYMADALTRSATIRYGNAYIGRFVTELLGRPAALVLTLGLVGICVLGMEADYIGISTLLDDATGIPPTGWVALLFAIELVYLRRGSIDSTVTSALVVGAINIAIILALCALAFAHMDASNLARVELPFVGGNEFDRDALALVFGVVFTAYFGHLSVGNCANVVLARDPSGRTLVRGVVAAQVTAIALYALFVVAIAGAVGPSLADAQGTALSPLADEAGAAVLALGAVLVVLGMGMASIYSGLALFYLVGERLPSRAPRTLVLPRRGARLRFEARRTTVALTYLGLGRGGGASVRLDVTEGGRTRSVEATASSDWEPFTEAPLADLGERGLRLRVGVLAASDQELRAEVSSSMRLSYEGARDTAGVGMAAILALDDREADVLAWILRRADASPSEVAGHAGLSLDAAGALLAALADRGLVAERLRGGERRYVARAARRRGGRLSDDVWDALKSPDDDGVAPPPSDARGRRAAIAARARSLLAGDRSRFAAGVAPVTIVFALAMWQASSGAISLADVLSFLGVITVALLAGVFPVLLLVAARSKGELAAGDYRLPVARWLLWTVYAITLGGVALHGLVLWEDPLRRVSALLVTVVALLLTVSMLRNGTFARRATIELCQDGAGDSARFSIVAAGRLAAVDVVLDYGDGDERRMHAATGEIAELSSLRRAVFSADWAGSDRLTGLKIRAHRITDEDESLPLDVAVEVDAGGESRALAVDALGEAAYELAAGVVAVAVIPRS